MQLETKEIIAENVGLEERNRKLLFTFIIVFIILVLLFVVRAQRARTRELLYKQAQQKANEDIYNLMMSQQAIIDELHRQLGQVISERDWLKKKSSQLP
jgi:type VI protein secretion system component VasK